MQQITSMKTARSSAPNPVSRPWPPRSSVALSPALVTLVLAGWQGFAADLYVSPAGLDSHPGTKQAPLQTPRAARDTARQFAGKEAVTIHVADGVYYLPETLVLAAADSGTAAHPVTYRAVNEGKAVLSGGQRLDLTWQPWRDGILVAATPAELVMDQLFVNGRRQRMARYPDFDPTKPTAAYQGYAADAISRERAAGWADPTGGYIHAMHLHRWGGYHYRITGKKPDGSLAYEGGWQNNRQMGMHPQFRMVENILEELDAPGEWFHDARGNRLYFLPEPGTDLNRALVEGVRLRHLVEFQGSAAAPVRFVMLQGFTFRHAARTFMDNREPLLRSDWTIYRGGAVVLTGTEDVRILDCEFDQPGANAIFVNLYNRRALIRGCHIHDTGASGVCFVGDPAAVREPLFEYGQRQDLANMDRTPGPKSDQLPGGLRGGRLFDPGHRPRRAPARGRADFHGQPHHRARHHDLRLRPRRHQHRRWLLGRSSHRALRCLRHGARNPRPRLVQLLGAGPLLGERPSESVGAGGETGPAPAVPGCRRADRAARQPLALRPRLGH
jgi:hypothetical protein